MKLTRQSVSWRNDERWNYTEKMSTAGARRHVIKESVRKENDDKCHWKSAYHRSMVDKLNSNKLLKQYTL